MKWLYGMKSMKQRKLSKDPDKSYYEKIAARKRKNAIRSLSKKSPREKKKSKEEIELQKSKKFAEHLKKTGYKK